MLSGMRTLGGMALTKAGFLEPPTREREREGEGERRERRESGGAAGRFVSRSAPESSGMGQGRRESSLERRPPAGVVEEEKSGPDGGFWVTVLDLERVREGERMLVALFSASEKENVTHLGWSGDGCSLSAAFRNGTTARIFRIRPSTSMEGTGGAELAYELRRGRTSAVVEGVAWAKDGRWVALGTRKGTVHVFAVNPYNGNADRRSHVDGRVRNVSELVRILYRQSGISC